VANIDASTLAGNGNSVELNLLTGTMSRFDNDDEPRYSFGLCEMYEVSDFQPSQVVTHAYPKQEYEIVVGGFTLFAVGAHLAIIPDIGEYLEQILNVSKAYGESVTWDHTTPANDEERLLFRMYYRYLKFPWRKDELPDPTAYRDYKQEDLQIVGQEFSSFFKVLSTSNTDLLCPSTSDIAQHTRGGQQGTSFTFLISPR
jgi:hypothetical protein